MNDKDKKLTQNTSPDEAVIPLPETAEANAELSAKVSTEVPTELSPQAVHAAEPEAEPEAEPAKEAAAPEPAIPMAAPVELPGVYLTARRKELRLSIEEISSRVKMAPRQIVAIEANDFAALPGLAVVRGFIRSYAKAMQLNPEPLVAMLAKEPGPEMDGAVLRRPLPSVGMQTRRYGSGASHRASSSRLLGLGLLVLIFLAVLAFAGTRMGWLSIPLLNGSALVSQIVPQNMQASLPELMTEILALSAPGDVEKSSPAKEIVAEVMPQKVVDPSRELEIKPREDAWVEISNLNGTKLVSRLMRAGSTEKFEVTEPIVLLVGNAIGVDVNLRGQSLNLVAVARDNVSKLSLK
jgi:cytoskeleton protein RodZ